MTAGRERAALLKKGRGTMAKDDNGVKVTDHALVRWLERKFGLDVERMRKDLYVEALDAAAGGKAVEIGQKRKGAVGVEKEGLTYVFARDNGTVITVMRKAN